MKINSYFKKKNNIYELTLDNNKKLELYDDVILKYDLLLKGEIDNKNLEEILEYNLSLCAYNEAVKYLNIKMRTKNEIIKKLNKYSKSTINYVIDRLNNEGYLNNEAYIKAYISDDINLKLNGPNKILLDLKKLGFEEIKILKYLNDYDNDIWFNKIRKTITKKINSNHNLSGLMLKNKIINDLITKGFRKEDILIVIEEFEFNDDIKIYEKEYLKLKNKLSKKYSGEELNKQISNYLFKKGFKIH